VSEKTKRLIPHQICAMQIKFIPKGKKKKKKIPTKLPKQGMCHNVALPFTLKKLLKAKEELWNLKYFTMQKYINLPKTL
jgi:hypothetical protein